MDLGSRRDGRRDGGQWRGYHNFQKVVCDGNVVSRRQRNAGLKMGYTYHYYYVVNGSAETHETTKPVKPTATRYPHLPGQTVNLLDAPRGQGQGLGSERLGSQGLEVDDKFTTPRPAPPVPNDFKARLRTAPTARPSTQKRTARSLSPPRWTGKARRLLGWRRGRAGSERGNSPDEASKPEKSAEASHRNRFSDDALYRLLVNDVLVPPRPPVVVPANDIPEKTDRERERGSQVRPAMGLNASSVTIVPQRPVQVVIMPTPKRRSAQYPHLDVPPSRFSLSTVASSPASPASSTCYDISSYFDHSSDDEDDTVSPTTAHDGPESDYDEADDESLGSGNYSLRAVPGHAVPRQSLENAGPSESLMVADRNLYSLPGIDCNLVGDMVSELRCMANAILSRYM